MSGLTANQIAAMRAAKADMYRHRVDVYRNPAPVGGKIGPMERVASNVPASIYEAVGPNSLIPAALGLTGAVDEHVGFTQYDTQEGDEWRIPNQTFTVQRVATTTLQYVVKLTEARL